MYTNTSTISFGERQFTGVPLLNECIAQMNQLLIRSVISAIFYNSIRSIEGATLATLATSDDIKAVLNSLKRLFEIERG